MDIAVVNYGLGNLRSISKGFEAFQARARVTSKLEDIRGSNGIVLPGVGAFKGALEKLSSLRETILEEVLRGKPILGVCLGLQLMFSRSFEGGLHEGLNLFKGDIVLLEEAPKLPHVGWNSLHSIGEGELTEGLEEGVHMYFVHSYAAEPVDPSIVAAVTRYGVEFPSIIEQGNLFATQFHPEKSGKKGLRILENFVKACKR
ncbi:MAG: imidazole glycerol phosphate synthase subunit HisH [Candidatus Bathyarchaeia archaeon]|nr:imidazole glycerol phosphate synthase subunit HisH [Candidatus Bathyarchaeota archaeon]